MQWSVPYSSLRYAVETQGSGSVLHLAGELDEVSVAAFEYGFARAYLLPGMDVTLELSRLTFCSLAGIQAFSRMRELLRADGGRLELRNPHSAVVRVLELTGRSHQWDVRARERIADAAQTHRPALVGVLQAAMRAVGTRMGSAQYFDQADGTLHLVAHPGFGYRFAEFFEIVRGSDSSCGAAAADLRLVCVEDVTTSPIFAGSPELDVLVEAGVGSCVSVPIVGARGLLGVVSVHRPRPGVWDPADRELLERVRFHAAQTQTV